MLPRLHLVATDGVIARAGFVELAERLLARGGADVALHLRSRRAAAAEMLELAMRMRQACERSGALLVVNDRVDIALAAGAAGVQLGAHALPPAVVRHRWPDLLIGTSVHDRSEALVALAAGADFLLAGTLWETPSHPGRPASGTGWLREIVEPGTPVIGIGGVGPGRAAELRELGVYGAAVVRAVWDADSPEAAQDALLARLHGR